MGNLLRNSAQGLITTASFLLPFSCSSCHCRLALCLRRCSNNLQSPRPLTHSHSHHDEIRRYAAGRVPRPRLCPDRRHRLRSCPNKKSHGSSLPNHAVPQHVRHELLPCYDDGQHERRWQHVRRLRRLSHDAKPIPAPHDVEDVLNFKIVT